MLRKFIIIIKPKPINSFKWASKNPLTVSDYYRLFKVLSC
uniref:Uncharacterized protein n=1 Tax=Heterorhabditis bacteriophora TaxID=37862 RepID=A0A1I7WK39_HETBA